MALTKCPEASELIFAPFKVILVSHLWRESLFCAKKGFKQGRIKIYTFWNCEKWHQRNPWRPPINFRTCLSDSFFTPFTIKPFLQKKKGFKQGRIKISTFSNCEKWHRRNPLKPPIKFCTFLKWYYDQIFSLWFFGSII